jgi:hypothetical protein
VAGRLRAASRLYFVALRPALATEPNAEDAMVWLLVFPDAATGRSLLNADGIWGTAL